MIIPKKIALANLPTPLQQISFNGKSFLIKRDDMSGLELSGNKVRKLEYLCSIAKKEKADYLFTCGGDQSNHSRATAVAAAMCNLKSKLFLWGKDSSNAEGNLFIDKFVGAEIKYLSKNEYDNVNNIMHSEKNNFSKAGLNTYIIPEGGSSSLGIWGYISFIEELKNQISIKKINGILTAAGSGGTSAGLLVGAALLKIPLKIFAVNVLYDKKIIEEKIFSLTEQCIKEFKLGIAIKKNMLEVIDGYSLEGYKKISVDKLHLIKEFARQTGIILDPAYTGKAFNAYYDNFLHENNNKTLFVHTGGLFGVFSKRKEYLAV